MSEQKFKAVMLHHKTEEGMGFDNGYHYFLARSEDVLAEKKKQGWMTKQERDNPQIQTVSDHDDLDRDGIIKIAAELGIKTGRKSKEKLIAEIEAHEG